MKLVVGSERLYHCLWSGDVYSWTAEDFRRLLQSGAFGVIDPDKYPALRPLRCLSRIEIVRIAACGNVAAAVSRAGQLFTWWEWLLITSPQ